MWNECKDQFILEQIINCYSCVPFSHNGRPLQSCYETLSRISLDKYRIHLGESCSHKIVQTKQKITDSDHFSFVFFPIGEGFNDWGGRGNDDFITGEVT